MKRHCLRDLDAWLAHEHRKPLVIRGARQVGKTTLVRLFADRVSGGVAELNFERRPELAQLFGGKNPRKTLELVELMLQRKLEPGRTLLFLDEIQAAPEVFAALRYFYEDLPEQPVLAAGSLLEFALEEPAFSVPVGRIEYLHLGPMTFEEVLEAGGRGDLVAFLAGWTPEAPIPEVLHRELLDWVARCFRLGGMPDSVRAFVETGSFLESERVKHSILQTFVEDFGKYGRKVPPARLRKVLERLPFLVGDKLKYSHIDREERSKDLADALHLLSLAKVGFKVRHSAANGVPLGAEADDRLFKMLFLDVGLAVTATGLQSRDLEQADDLLLVNRGALAEQFVGQHLLYSGATWETPQLFYWVREKASSNAEVDYLLSSGAEILPVEVKAGKTGRLKSLHLFLSEKKRRFAIRISSAPPSLMRTEATLPNGEILPFHLLSLPLYFICQVRRLADLMLDRALAEEKKNKT
jgi:uncharacterized protein